MFQGDLSQFTNRFSNTIRCIRPRSKSPSRYTSPKKHTMPPKKNDKDEVRLPDHVFIEQGPNVPKTGTSRLVSSQARRYQSADKRRQDQVSSQQGADYARSLVGWRSGSSTPPVRRSRTTSPKLHVPSAEESIVASEARRRSPGNQFDIKGIDNHQLIFDVVDGYPSGAVAAGIGHQINSKDASKALNELHISAALENDMVRDATIAVEQVVFALQQQRDLSQDQMMLQHRGRAIAALRDNLGPAATASEEAVIFTVGRFVSIAVSCGSILYPKSISDVCTHSTCRTNKRRSMHISKLSGISRINTSLTTRTLNYPPVLINA
jgi:hypothetical protein